MVSPHLNTIPVARGARICTPGKIWPVFYFIPGGAVLREEAEAISITRKS